jgi:hypothetical protein
MRLAAKVGIGSYHLIEGFNYRINHVATSKDVAGLAITVL